MQYTQILTRQKQASITREHRAMFHHMNIQIDIWRWCIIATKQMRDKAWDYNTAVQICENVQSITPIKRDVSNKVVHWNTQQSKTYVTSLLHKKFFIYTLYILYIHFVYSSHVIFSYISPNLPFRPFPLYRRLDSYPPLWNKCPSSSCMRQQSL